MNNIIDNPIDLVKLTTEELDEILLNEKYNKANLRQLIRSCITCLNTQIEVSQYHAKNINIYKNSYYSLIEQMQKVINENL